MAKFPRLTPRVDPLAVAHAQNLPSRREAQGKGAIIRRAEVDFVTDPACAPLSDWIGTWVQRWPNTSRAFWRRASRSRSWDLRRQEAWQAYEGQAIETFVEAELDARQSELVHLREVRAEVLKKIRQEAAQPKSLEGLVRALVDLDKHISEKRSETVARIGANVLGQAVGADGRPLPPGQTIDVTPETSVFATQDDAHALVRALLTRETTDDSAR